MGSIVDKLQAAIDSKNAIKTKFGLADDLPFSQYAENINVGSTTSGETELYYYSDVKHIENELYYNTNILVVSGFPTDVNLICGPIDINGEYTLVDNEATGYDRKWLNAEKGLYIADSMGGGTWFFECENKSVVGRLYPTYKGMIPDTPEPFLNTTTSFEWELMGTDIEGSVLPFSYTKTYNMYTANKIYKKQNSKYYISALDEYFNWETEKPFVGKFYNRDLTVQSDYVYGPEPVLITVGGGALQLENPFAIDTDRVWSATITWTNTSTGQVEDEWYFKAAFSAENQRWEFRCNGDILCFTTDLENWPNGIRYIEYYDRDRAVNVNDELIRSVNIVDILDTTGTVIPVTINIEDDVYSFVYEVVVADDSVVEFEQVNKTNTSVTLNFTSCSTTFIPDGSSHGSHTLAQIYLYDYEKHKVCIGVINLGVSYDILKKHTINITSVPEISGTVGTALTAQVVATVINRNGETTTYSPKFTASGLPDGLTMDSIGAISGTPTTEASGTYTVTASCVAAFADTVSATDTYNIEAATEPDVPTAFTGNLVLSGFPEPLSTPMGGINANGVWQLGRLNTSSGEFTIDSTVTGLDRAWKSPDGSGYIYYQSGTWYIDPIGGLCMFQGIYPTVSNTESPYNDNGTSFVWKSMGSELTGATVLPEQGGGGGEDSGETSITVTGFASVDFGDLDGTYTDDGTGVRFVNDKDYSIRWVKSSEAIMFGPAKDQWCILEPGNSYVYACIGGEEGDLSSIACTNKNIQLQVDAYAPPVTIVVSVGGSSSGGRTGNIVLANFSDTLSVMGGSATITGVNGVWKKGTYNGNTGFTEDPTATGQQSAYQNASKTGIISYYWDDWHIDPTGFVEMYGGINANSGGAENPYNEDGSSFNWSAVEGLQLGTVTPE